jgi:hypothetical protein
MNIVKQMQKNTFFEWNFTQKNLIDVYQYHTPQKKFTQEFYPQP